MAKKNKDKGKKNQKALNFNILLFFGLILIAAALVLKAFIPDLSKIVTNLLYITALFSFVVYMWQIAYEKRTGKPEPGAESKGNRLKGRK